MTGKELKNILAKNDIVLAELARELDITPQSLNDRLRVKSVKTDFIMQVKEITGLNIGETQNYDKGNPLFPLIPIEAVAGFPSDDVYGVSYADCPQYRIPDFEDKGVDYLIRVSGSSMYPKYSNGDVLACKKIKDILFFQWGKVYVIDSSQGALVKRIFEDESNSDNIICVSDNRDNYPPFSMPKSDIRSLSIVLGVVRVE